VQQEVYERIIRLLEAEGAPFRQVRHGPTRTSAESAEARGEELRIGGKAILMKVEDDFKLFVLSAARRIDSSKIKAFFQVKRLRFARPDELAELTGLVPGSVPPFGPPVLDLELFTDASIGLNERIAFNAGSLTDSIIMEVRDYVKLASPVIFDFSGDAPESGSGDEGDPGEVTLRHVTPAELPFVRIMTEETWRHSFAQLLSEEQIEYMLSGLYSLASMRDELGGREVSYRFICRGGRRVGFCAFGPAGSRGALKIHKFYVLPRYQGCGYGSSTLSRIEEGWKESGGTSLVLLVNKGNERAVHLYRKNGFEVRESLCTDIGGGFVMDDYLMEKNLP
jgi:prolyl-tRNA editing enzyme YbaK/EbsC (Cys-tRNA(Pro) deacylase)/ribosomal protein S18 acetylase RimI-like enzyme